MTDQLIEQEKLDMLAAAIARLPRAVDPPDAWPGIRAAIERGSSGSGSGSTHRPFWQRPVLLAAAALLLVAGSSGVTYLALKRDAPQLVAVPEPSVPPSAFAQFATRENNYIETATRLTAMLYSADGTLAPETIARLRKSVAVIDAAILEAREALAADPGNRQLIEMLSSSYDKKLDLLNRSAQMVRS